ncbi:MAG: metallo-mystery pair system four-Cys motif protein [Anaerolineae bacterium]|nr:metallo-mystery pair system four-Cys motif protein [Anaerolineae bacterium]
MQTKIFAAASVLAVALVGCAPAVAPEESFSVKFALKANNEDIVCGKEYANLGAKQSKAQIIDARFYVSNVRLVTAQGQEVPLKLDQDQKWQYDNVALLDFENGTGLCRDSGTADLRDIVVGKAPAGKYTGVNFDLGVPFKLNHADVTKAPSPLNVQAMWWNWQGGYKFVRIDLRTDSAAPDNTWLIHLGSTGCGGAMGGGHDMSADTSKPPAMPCKNSNLAGVSLKEFDPKTSVVVADLGGLLKNVNVRESTPKPPGCMSGPDDPDCANLLPNFGLGSGQTLFRVDKAK